MPFTRVTVCIVLFFAGLRMDERSLRARASYSDATPMRRSLAALQHENHQLRSRINTTEQENILLRESLRAKARSMSKKAGAPIVLESDLPKKRVPEDAAESTYAAPTVAPRPRSLAERLRRSTEFNKERALAVAVNGQIMLTFVNRIRLDFASSWVAHVRRLRMTNWLVGATDRHALRELKSNSIPCFDMSTNLPEGEWPWGSPSFKALGPHKIELIYKSLTWGLEVLITDVDAFVLRDPFPHVARWPDAGFLTTSDHLGNTTIDGGLEDHRGIHTAFNIGYMFFRKSAMPLVEEWRSVIRADPRNKWDQGEFNRLARLKWKPNRYDGLSDRRLFWSYKEQVIGGVLSLALFCGGHNYFVSQFAQRVSWEPYSIHTTYQYGAAAGKRHRLREARVWYDPPRYYDPPSGVLSFTLDVPDELVHPPGGMTVQGHIALINAQLRQIRSALALAHALGRKLVLPSVTCGYDKYWGPLWRKGGGVIPGTHTWALPIRNCPLDHFLEPAMLDPVETVREWSFLSNPRTPRSVLASVRHVPLTEESPQQMQRLKELAAIKVLNISSSLRGRDLAAPASTLLDSQQKRAFTFKFRYTGGSWCCAPMDEMKAGAPRSAHFNLMRA